MSSRTIYILLIGFLLEIAVIFLLLNYSASLGIFAHLSILAGLYYFLPRKNRLVQIYIFSTAFLGPLGAAGSLILIIYHELIPARGKSFIEWFNSIFPKNNPTLAEEIEEAIEQGRDLSAANYSVVPMQDIMALGNSSQQQRALLNIANNFHPVLIPVLQQALKSKIGFIRVLASTIIARVNNKIHSSIMSLERSIAFRPNNSSLVKKLADWHDLYAFSGLVEKNKEKQHRLRALEYFLRYIEMEPEDVEARQKIARIYIRQEHYEEVIGWVEQCRADNVFSLSMLMWQAEALFRLKKFSVLRKLAGESILNFSQNEDYPEALKEAMNLWSGNSEQRA